MTITVVFDPPLPSDSPATFNTKAFTLLGDLNDWSTEANALAVEVTADEAALAVAVSSASTSASTATTQAGIATTQAGIATTQAGTATTQASTATTQASNASTSASTATTQAGIATTKAAEATASAAAASAIVLGVSTNHPTIRPSLNLDFANSQVVDPRITFTRASTATRTNSKGLIESVASGVPRIDYDPVTLACKGLMIEESRVNLFTYSEQFDNAAWTKVRATITANATTAPDGTVTADKLVEDATASNTHGTNFPYSTATNQYYTVSIFLKAAERHRVRLEISDAAAGGASATFNLSTGTIAVAAANGGDLTSASATINSVGNGWYRCTVTALKGVSNTNTFCYVFADNGTTATYTGDGTSGLFLWGAQLEAGAFATSYQPSTETWTARASTATFFGSNGLIQTASSGVARMNYNPMNLTVQPKLLLEAAATNLLVRSEEFDNALWLKQSGASISANSVAAPDGSLTADTLTTNGTGSYIDHPSVAMTNGQKYAVSFYAKAGAATTVASVFYGANFNSGGANINPSFDLVNGVAAGNAENTQIQSVGNGWYRCSFAVTLTAATGSYVNQLLRPQTTAGSIYIWGAQLEASSYPTSYIPTVASQVTRVADSSTSAQTTRAADVASMTGTNFTSWYRQDEGSFVETNIVGGNAASQEIIQVTDGTVNEAIAVRYSSGSLAQFSVTDGGVAQCSIAPAGFSTIGSTYKRAVAYKINDFAQSINGGSVSTDASGTLPTVTQMVLGTSLNGHLSNVAYYPKRLTNAELQALSTQ